MRVHGPFGDRFLERTGIGLVLRSQAETKKLQSLELASARARSDSSVVLRHCTQLCDLTPLRGRQDKTAGSQVANDLLRDGFGNKGTATSGSNGELLPWELRVDASDLTFRGQKKQEIASVGGEEPKGASSSGWWQHQSLATDSLADQSPEVASHWLSLDGGNTV